MGDTPFSLRTGRMLFAALCILGLPSSAYAITESEPQIEWLHQYGTSDDESALNATTLQVNSPGSPQYSYTVTTVESALPGQTHEGGIDSVLRKYDSQGNLIWERQFGTSGDDIATSVLASDGSGQAYVAGYTSGNFPGTDSLGGVDGFVRQYDENGNVMWTHTYGTSGTDEFHACSFVMSEGNIVCVGRTTGELSGFTNTGGFDALMIGLENNGMPNGIAEMYGTVGDDIATAVKGVPQVIAIYVAGSVAGALPDQTSLGGSDLFLKKYDPNGGPMWTKQMGTAGNDDHASIGFPSGAIIVSASTDDALSGFTNEGGVDAIIMRMDTDGNLVTQTQIGTAGDDIPVSSFGQWVSAYAMVGGTTTGVFSGQTSAGGTDIFLVKFDGGGTQIWLKQFGSAGTDNLTTSKLGISSEIDSGAFDVYVTGDTTGSLPGNTSAGGTDAFFGKIVQDEDDDFIYNNVDLAPGAYSNDFNDGVTSGSVTDRGTQELTIMDVPGTTGVEVAADPTGEATDPAEVTLCQNSATAVLDPGDAVELTCGSAIISVIDGEVDTAFESPDGFTAVSTFDEGNTLRFAVESNEFTTPQTNVDPVTLSIGATDQTLIPGTKLVIVTAVGDTFLRKGAKNKNEGSNPVLLARKQGDVRSLVQFNPSEIPLTNLRKATLILTVNGSNAPDGWSNAGRYIDVHRMTETWTEGNGKDLDLPEEESTRGNGSGATWNCDTDTDISNQQKNCNPEWDGAETSIATATAPGYLMKNNFTGQAAWDVTTDVLSGAGSYGWMIKKREENKAGNVRFYSREGAGAEINFVPQLLLEYNN